MFILSNNNKFFLTASLFLGLSIMYQVYFVEFSDGVIVGGGLTRLILKITFITFFIMSLKKYISWNIFMLNMFYKIPIIFVSVTIIFLIPFLSKAYLQALNLVFFLPILLIDWNRPGGDILYRQIWVIIIVVVCIQLILHPMLASFFQVGWSNAAYIGGMGNANVFGVFLISTGLASIFLLQKHYKYISIILFLSTILTGSLVSMLVGYACLSLQVYYFLIRRPSSGLFLLGLFFILFILYFSSKGILIKPSPAVEHVLNKSVGLLKLVIGDYDSRSTSSSISVRLEYINLGFKMMVGAPLSFIVGHPNFIPMYNGDGLWVSYVVTYGVPITLYFLIINLMLCYRGIKSKNPDLKFSACIIVIMLFFFVSNRILDYWPAALIYILAFSYLTTKGVGKPVRKYK